MGHAVHPRVDNRVRVGQIDACHVKSSVSCLRLEAGRRGTDERNRGFYNCYDSFEPTPGKFHCNAGEKVKLGVHACKHVRLYTTLT